MLGVGFRCWWTMLAACGCLLVGSWVSAIELQRIAPGIYEGEAPRDADDYRQLRQLGVRTVLDCRTFCRCSRAREERQVVCRGMRYIHLPIGFCPMRDPHIEPAIALLLDPRLQPIYVHCELGRDRTALLAALYRVRYLGWNTNVAFSVMQASRFNRLLFGINRYFWTYTYGR